MKVIKINPKKIEKTKLILVANLLKDGKVIIFPTDTVYIPIADATNPFSVKKVFQIKKRSRENPIPIFVKNIKMAKKIARIDKTQENFLKDVWPGRVTAVLKRRKTEIRLFGVDKKTIALRIPKFEPVNFLLKKLDFPLVGTSANISGKPPSGNIKEVLRQFEDKRYQTGRSAPCNRFTIKQPDLIVDAGNLPKNKLSTVLDLTVFPPKILRI
jgi:L-threonylcarbamoyladenylate synthase